MADPEFPDDHERGMFGLRRAFETGPSALPPSDPHKRLRDAMLARAMLATRLRKPRGRKPANWRTELRPIIADVLRSFPNAGNAEIVVAVLNEAGWKPWPRVSERTLENWLCQVRRLLI
jgi:hypothetical protein